jgi:hypothetical protein
MYVLNYNRDIINLGNTPFPPAGEYYFGDVISWPDQTVWIDVHLCNPRGNLGENPLLNIFGSLVYSGYAAGNVTMANVFDGLTPGGGVGYFITAHLGSGGGDTTGYYYWAKTVPPPRADFTCAPTSVGSPGQVTCTDTSSVNMTAWTWQISNGVEEQEAYVQNPVFDLTTAGNYSVILFANYDGTDYSKIRNGYILVGGNPPLVTFHAFGEYFAPMANATVYISDGQSGTTDINGDMTRYVYAGAKTAYANKPGYVSYGYTKFDSSVDTRVQVGMYLSGGTPTPTPTPTPNTTPYPPLTPEPTASPTATPTPGPGSPSAEFTWTGNCGIVIPPSQTVTVTLTSTSTGASTYAWTLIAADGYTYPLGTASTATFPAAMYTTDGNGYYFVTLEVWSADGHYSWKQHQVPITPQCVIPTITPTPTPTGTPEPVIGGGVISFDKSQYISGETATITYLFDTPVWQVDNNSAYITIRDNYGVTIPNSGVKLSNFNNPGSITVSLTPFDVYKQGIYIARLETRDWLGITSVRNTTSMIIDNGVVMSGYINGITMLPISGATITMSQPSTSRYNTTTSNTTGYWVSPNFTAGGSYPITLVVSKTNYDTDTSVLTYYLSQTDTTVNRTLIPTSLTNVTNAVTGIVSSSVGSKAPLPGALVVLTGKLGGVTTNISTQSGAYAFTQLTLNATYAIYSSEVTGYQTSPIKQFVAGDFSTILTIPCTTDSSCWL